jgi:signal transduction protein with GAF and PtsI domain
MKEELINYETFIKVSNAISHSKDPQEVALMTVEGITAALKVKGCTLFLLNSRTDELQLAASYGLSDEYLNKGPISSLHSIAESIKDGPVAIYNVLDDPRLQYPVEAIKEGIASILSVPMQVNGKIIGAIRVYTAKPWEFTLSDVNFVAALAQITGMSIRLAHYAKGMVGSIDMLKSMRTVQPSRSTRMTPFEGVPKSFSAEQVREQYRAA